MPTNAANGRLKSAFVVISSIDEFRSRAIPKLAARPVAKGQPMMNYDVVFDSLRGELSWAGDNLFQKDLAFVHELADDQKYFDDREETGSGLRQVIIDGRGLFQHCYRPPKISEFGFPDEVSRDPEALYQEGRHLDQRLREPDLPLPKPWSDKLVIAPVTIADEVAPWVAELGAVLEHVRRERKEATLARMARREALDTFDQTFLWVARTCESLFSLAGEKELAKRVRPSATRPGRTEEDPDSDDGTVPTPPGLNGTAPAAPPPGSAGPAGGTDTPPSTPPTPSTSAAGPQAP